MKIAYIITSLAQEGPANVVMDLVKVMMAHGHYCKVYYFDDKSNEHIFPCETQKIKFSEKIPFNDYDIIHTHSLRPDIYAFFHKPFASKSKLICTIHNFVFNDLISDHGRIKGIIGGIIWQIARYRNDRIIVLNKTAQHYYSRWFNNKKIRIAYNTRVLDFSQKVQSKDIELINNLRTKYKTILCSICRITHRKGLDRIIKALPLVNSNICFLIIGDGPEVESLKQLSSNLGVEDRVIFLGSRYDGYKYMPYIDIICIPSHSEGFPLAMLEACCYGKPIISSNLPVFAELFDDSEIVTCIGDDIKSYAVGINHAIEHSDILGTTAKARFDSDYSPEAFYNTHIKIYNEVIK